MTDGPDQLPSNRRTGAFERRVAQSLNDCLTADEPVVVACSGGPDSLSALVATGRSRPAGTVIAACFDHQLRPTAETEGDVALVAEVAGRLGACFVSDVPSTPLAGDERSAREARYRWLGEVCARFAARICVTGHTEDDQAETVLLRLARGSGLGGAAGMRMRAPWPVELASEAAPELLRPLLAITRADVEGYLDALGLEARLDSTNELVTYARNRLRSRVVPELELLNPRTKPHLAAFAARARLDDEALEEWAAREFAAHGKMNEGEVSLTRSSLRRLPAAVTTRVFRLGAAKLGLSLTSEQLDGALGALERSGYEVSIEGGQLRSGREYVVIVRQGRTAT
ncbi:MAG: tRNA lysidine(34) synthetase TilS [Dehalococcoidia bacterium]|nr:tRNA lysidine(34) synthetase TilS [Dehalococcoidia bacterium]